jgi:hypothetical protein
MAVQVGLMKLLDHDSTERNSPYRTLHRITDNQAAIFTIRNPRATPGQFHVAHLLRIIDTARNIGPSKNRLRIHSGVKRSTSSLVTQIKTGKMSLGAFLYSCKVPGYLTTQCGCEGDQQTASHVLAKLRHYSEENGTSGNRRRGI